MPVATGGAMGGALAPGAEEATIAASATLGASGPTSAARAVTAAVAWMKPLTFERSHGG